MGNWGSALPGIICVIYAGATPIVFACLKYQAAIHGVALDLNDTFLTVSYVGAIAGILNFRRSCELPKLPAPPPDEPPKITQQP